MCETWQGDVQCFTLTATQFDLYERFKKMSKNRPVLDSIFNWQS
jgi:hypothetical protein